MAFGDDPYLHGLWRMSGSNARATPAHFEEVLGHTSRRAVFVLELSQAFDQSSTGRFATRSLDSRPAAGS